LARTANQLIGDPGLALGVAIGAIANLIMYLYVWSALPTLPELMPLHYNGAGVVDLIGRPGELFKLPVIGTLILVVNAVGAAILHQAERPAAHILLWTAATVQLAFGAGVWLLVSKAAGE
jgi:hypothetical protein